MREFCPSEIAFESSSGRQKGIPPPVCNQRKIRSVVERAGVAGHGWVDIGILILAESLVVRGERPSDLGRDLPARCGDPVAARWLGARALPFYLDRKQIWVKRASLAYRFARGGLWQSPSRSLLNATR